MPGWGGTQRVIKTVGVAHGLTLLLSGQAVDAQRAYDLKLVDAIVQESALEEELTNFLRNLTEVSTGDAADGGNLRRARSSDFVSDLAQFDLTSFGVLSAAQTAIYQATAMGITHSTEQGMRAERELFYPLLMSPDVQGKLHNFVNRSKRNPN
jgi:3-hydroxyacyl-CoA dehydrogenase